MKEFIFELLLALALLGSVFLVGVHVGRNDLRDTAREEFSRYKPGMFLRIHSLDVGINAFGQVNVYPKGVSK